MDRARAELLKRLAAGPARVGEAARRTVARPSGATGPDSAAGPAPWTARENVAHLVLVERLVFQARLDQLAAGGEPTWAWTEPGTSDGHDVATLEAALASFAAARSETMARVARLDDEGWRRFGHHATFGRLDVTGLLGIIADHDEQHRADLGARGEAAIDEAAIDGRAR